MNPLVSAPIALCSGRNVHLPRLDQDSPDPIKNPYALWVRDALEVAYNQVRRQKRLYDKQAVKRLFAVGDWIMRYYPPAKKCKLDSPCVGPYLFVSLAGWAVGGTVAARFTD